MRRASAGQWRIGDYIEWLEEADLPVPAERTLQSDVHRYAALCDDVSYGRTITLNDQATTDAVRWFLGAPWVDHPLAPPLYSSVVRCLLLAMQSQQEVLFSYAPMPREDKAPTETHWHTGIPWRMVPGFGAAHLFIWRKDGRLMPLNLVRIRGLVKWTGRDATGYAPPQFPKAGHVVVTVSNPLMLDRLRLHYPALQRRDAQTAIFPVPATDAVMVSDMLEGWIRRTEPVPERQVARHWIQQDGSVTIDWESHSES
ncbi:MAG: hypothetical protein OWR62_10145 [Sulfobacillus thermotolerans]|nr:hypothetical protein [Sulfobacillus thermotolerans]